MGAGDENNMEIFSSEYAQLRQLAAKYSANERENPPHVPLPPRPLRMKSGHACKRHK